jgi:hypothetical protein
VSAEPPEVAGLVLTPPNAVALPIADRGDVPAPRTMVVVAERWPEIERLLADGRAADAISSLESLATEMRRATESDAPLFRDALTLARRVLYNDLAEVGRAGGYEKQAHEVLARCATWDAELRPQLEELAS